MSEKGLQGGGADRERRGEREMEGGCSLPGTSLESGAVRTVITVAVNCLYCASTTCVSLRTYSEAGIFHEILPVRITYN